MRRRGPAVDTHDAAALAAATRRTRLVHALLAAAALLALAGAAVSVRGLAVRERSVLPAGSTGVLVVDLSLSIADADYRLIRRGFERVIADDGRIGLVVFSDVAYELLPPGTPARELEPFLRLLVPARKGRPPNPWAQTFRSGTRISTALALGGRMLERERVDNGSILLFSDLQTAPEDVRPLARTVASLKERDVPVRIVALSPLIDGRRLFEGLLGPDAYTVPPDAGDEGAATLRTESARGVPLALLALALLLFAVLAAYERFAASLALPRPKVEHA